MKKYLALVTPSLGWAVGSAAPASDQSIRTPFSVMKAESMLDDIFASIEPAMDELLAEAQLQFPK